MNEDADIFHGLHGMLYSLYAELTTDVLRNLDPGTQNPNAAEGRTAAMALFEDIWTEAMRSESPQRAAAIIARLVPDSASPAAHQAMVALTMAIDFSATAARTPALPESTSLANLPAQDAYSRHAGQVFAIVLMWLIVLLGPVAMQQSKLSAETQQTINDYYSVIVGIAIGITGAYLGKTYAKRKGK